MRTGRWRGWAPTQLLGVELDDAPLGIVGLGRTGRAVARRARGSGMRIHYHARNRQALEVEQGAVDHATLDSLRRKRASCRCTARRRPRRIT